MNNFEIIRKNIIAVETIIWEEVVKLILTR